MPFTFSGEFVVRRRVEEVYDFLTDPKRVGPVLPDFHTVMVRDEKHFDVKLKVGIAHIRGIADVKVELAEAERPRHALYRGEGSLPGGTVNFTAGFDLEESADGTRVAWKGEAQVSGLVASLAGGLLQPLAQKNIQKAIDGLRAAMG